MIELLKELFSGGFGLPLTAALFFLVLCLIKLIFDKPIELQVEEVLDYLKRMEAGEVDHWVWDGFINVPIKDSKLDSIRSQCQVIWTSDIYMAGDPEIGDFELNDAGYQEIKLLIKRCNEIIESKTSKGTEIS